MPETIDDIMAVHRANGDDDEAIHELRTYIHAREEIVELACQLSGMVLYMHGGNVALGGKAWEVLTQLCLAAKALEASEQSGTIAHQEGRC